MSAEGTWRITGSAAVIFDAEGKVLLVHHTYGPKNWELPGGGADFNESPIDTVVREVREETGLSVSVTRLTGVYYEPTSENGELLHFAFRCELSPPDQTPTPDGKEASEAVYWPTDALPRPICNVTIQRIMDTLRERTSILPVTIEREWFY